jgi:hypothetical protein
MDGKEKRRNWETEEEQCIRVATHSPNRVSDTWGNKATHEANGRHISCVPPFQCVDCTSVRHIQMYLANVARRDAPAHQMVTRESRVY